ncbi:MAG: NAD-dependent epimerase/dehydratase family protein [Gemmatimonadota bacterium]|nr:NAD-dependent epimerase/dehydratase family protein [Gammaproteobacteria bacterium]MDE2784426.1 NAD-dependent epimerase/dehydratase family protein [Gemmatimonadota bacterium]
MTHTRRRFLATSAAAAGAAALTPGQALSTDASRPGSPLGSGTPYPGPAPALDPSPRPLNILILGGTGFIGPHQVRYAMYRGHQVSIFNRGRSAPDLFPGVETLIGDRDGQIDALRGRTWDAVIDNSGYVPRHVRDTAELLQDSVGRYLFTSTGSVYTFDQDEITEDGELLPIEDPESEDVDRYYGPLKILCENAVTDTFRERATVFRLHVVAGPGDTTDRFTYWPVRIDHGGEVIAPGSPDTPVQYIDVRDLAEFMILALERDIGGTFNTAGPALDPTSMAEFLYGVRAITSAQLGFTWVDEQFLIDREARFQLWYPPDNGPLRGISRVRSHKAVAAGLKFRPLAVTALDTLDWFNTQSEERRNQLQLNLDRDRQILEEWKAR